ncbi:centromere protein O [Alligator mississippiensis]|uniref:centromere protein O n=1 Tax=Alligator mississippiensis TaxID=8496 RepID=UPI0028772FB6|nr:centromere protein O [Alligator mississippiensis]
MEPSRAYLSPPSFLPACLPGVLSRLEKLEARARALALKQEEAEQQQRQEVARLRARIKQLRRRRDELKGKVSLQQAALGRREEATSSGAEPVPTARVQERALLQWKVETVEAMLRVFYLTGISGKLTERGVCFCLSTAYDGNYLDSYYLDIVITQPVRIHRHSVPIFIPLKRIAAKYLQTDVRCFLATLSAHLNAYVGRKYQADYLQKHFSAFLGGHWQKNSLYNMLAFNYDVTTESSTFPFRVKLLYGDLDRSLPTEASVSCKEDVPASLLEKAATHSSLFMNMALHKAFDTFRKAAETPDNTE